MPAKRYNWERLLSCSRFRLVRGVDYDCSTRGMAQQVRQAASERGMHVRLVESDDWIVALVSRESLVVSKERA